MKTLRQCLIPSLLFTALFFGMCKSSGDQEVKTGNAGDQFDLFAVMKTFETSSSPEDFEKSINTKSTGINNLDLNEDGSTDYIRVVDKEIDASAHALILQVDVAEGKTQDVAVIEIEKSGDEEAFIQIIGDEKLYGSDFIVEPQSSNAEAGFVVATTVGVNVWAWPVITYIYSPAYVVWVSPYRYDYYPVWWEPWPVVSYEVYYPLVKIHHKHYGFADGYRFVKVHEHYHSKYRVTTKFNYHEHKHGIASGPKNKHKSSGKNVSSPDHQKGSPGGKNTDSKGKNDRNDKQGNTSSRELKGSKNTGREHNAPSIDKKGNGGIKSEPGSGKAPKGNSSPDKGGKPSKTGNGGGKRK